MNNWLKKLKKKAILPAAAFLVAAAAIGTTFAWQKWDLEITNNLKAHDTIVSIVEKDFNPETGVKEVAFHNDGDSSVFLRISYSDYWIKGEDKHTDKHQEPVWIKVTEGSDEVLEETIILSNKMANGDDIAVKKWTTVWPEYQKDPDSNLPEPKKDEEWVDGGDGWYYYKKVLKKNETTARILNGVIFPTVPEEYETANYRLFFKAEVVQCSDGSHTLNSEDVNDDATYKMFKKVAKVNQDGINVQWYNKADNGNLVPIN